MLGAKDLKHGAGVGSFNFDQDVVIRIKSIISDPKKLHDVSMLSPEQFDFLCYKARIVITGSDGYQMFWDDDGRSSELGIWFRLYIRHAVLIALVHKKEGASEASIGAFFLVSESRLQLSVTESGKVDFERRSAGSAPAWLMSAQNR